MDGKTHQLSDYAKTRVLAIVFTCNSCPVSQLYESRIEKLFRDYRGKGVSLVAINPNHPNAAAPEVQAYSDLSDSLEDMKIRAEYRRLDYPYLYDGDKQEAAMRYGPAAAPHIFIFDRDRKLRYQGRIDDNLREELAQSHDARNAIDALLAGKTVAVSTTPAFGCSPQWASNSSAVSEAVGCAWTRSRLH